MGSVGRAATSVDRGQGGDLAALVEVAPDRHAAGRLFPRAGYEHSGKAAFTGADFNLVADFNPIAGDDTAAPTAAVRPPSKDALEASRERDAIHCGGGCGGVWDAPMNLRRRRLATRPRRRA